MTRAAIRSMNVRELKGAAFNVGRLATLLPEEGGEVQFTPERRAAFRSAVDAVLDLFYPESCVVSASESEQAEEWLKATCKKLDDMGFVVVGRSEWEDVIPRFAAAFPERNRLPSESESHA